MGDPCLNFALGRGDWGGCEDEAFSEFQKMANPLAAMIKKRVLEKIVFHVGPFVKELDAKGAVVAEVLGPVLDSFRDAVMCPTKENPRDLKDEVNDFILGKLNELESRLKQSVRAFVDVMGIP